MVSVAEDIEIRLVLDAIHARYGYDLRGYAPASMRRRVQAALARSGLAHLGELQHRLLNDPELFSHLIDELTVQVTEMFRDPTFFAAFREQVVPVLRTYPEIKVWHAGCATGEEVYATAIVLSEHELYERAQIYGTDLSPRAIATAKQATYAEDKIARFAESYLRAGGRARLEDYCVRGYGNAILREGIRKHAVFFQHNLVSDFSLGTMQVIFCRNVLMYLGPEARDRALTVFRESLCRGGFLCLGTAESLPSDHAQAFRPVVPSERIFQYRGDP